MFKCLFASEILLIMCTRALIPPGACLPLFPGGRLYEQGCLFPPRFANQPKAEVDEKGRRYYA